MRVTLNAQRDEEQGCAYIILLERKAAECSMLKGELEKYEKHIKHLERGEAIKEKEETFQ